MQKKNLSSHPERPGLQIFRKTHNPLLLPISRKEGGDSLLMKRISRQTLFNLVLSLKNSSLMTRLSAKNTGTIPKRNAAGRMRKSNFP